MELRRARVADALAAQQVVQAGFEAIRAFAPAGWDPPDETREEELERSRAQLADPRTVAFLALDGGSPVGHVRICAAERPGLDGTWTDLHFRHLFVRPSHWGTGVAQRLHDAAMAEARGSLKLVTPAVQARARRFYERAGWNPHAGPVPEPLLGLDVVEYRTSR